MMRLVDEVRVERQSKARKIRRRNTSNSELEVFTVKVF
jgi:hypothetical protein